MIHNSTQASLPLKLLGKICGVCYFVCEMTLSCPWEKMERIRAEKTENKMFYVLALSGFGCVEVEVQ